MRDRPAGEIRADRSASPQSKHFFVAAVVLAVTIWPIGFNLGAYGTIFYDLLLEIWAISLAALLAGLFVDRRADTDLLSKVDVAILILPSLWLLTNQLEHSSGSSLATWLNYVLTFTTGFVAVPHILHLVLPISMPEVLEVRGIRRTLNLVILTALIALAAFTVGYYNDQFMTCQDFAVAGNAEPTNCRKGTENFQHGTFRLPD